MTDTWQNCYDDGWRGLIVDDAFGHPAKMALGLTKRIFKHAFEQGWLKKGDTVCDPFGGIGSTAIVGTYEGCRVVCVELEPKFVALSQRNFDLHRRKWERLGVTQPVILQGDSRELLKVLRGADCIVGSPPFSEVVVCQDKAFKLNDGRTAPPQGQQGYGFTPGQLAAMKPGDVQAIVGSPPYEGSHQDYSETEGCRKRLSAKGATRRTNALLRSRHGCTEGYGSSSGQLGETTGETFWSAAREIMQQCHTVLKPGGMAVWVVKRFVRKGALVDFPGDWLKLCESCGFTLVCCHQVMLTKETVENHLFDGEVTNRKERKSFFRRLAERKGSPPIDWEDVLCLRRV